MRSRLVFEPSFDAAIRAPDPLAPLITEVCPGVFKFKMLDRATCKVILDEVDKHPSEAPNSMNRYGQVLKDIGMGRLCDELLHEVVNPLVRRFYPGIGLLKKTHGFIVNYNPKKQGSLDLHYDESVVTLNVCLGRKFTGGKLVFHEDDGKVMATVEHKVGTAVLHLGEHQHQARALKSGNRSNLILWCKR